MDLLTKILRSLTITFEWIFRSEEDPANNNDEKELKNPFQTADPSSGVWQNQLDFSESGIQVKLKFVYKLAAFPSHHLLVWLPLCFNEVTNPSVQFLAVPLLDNF